MSQFNNPELNIPHFNRVHQGQSVIIPQRNYNHNINEFTNSKNGSEIYPQIYHPQKIASQQASTRLSKYQNKYSFKRSSETQRTKGPQIIYKPTTMPYWTQKKTTQHQSIVTKNEPITSQQRPHTDRTRAFTPVVAQPMERFDKCIFQMRELKVKIQMLQVQRNEMRDKIKYFEQSNAVSNKNSQQAIFEIEHLKGEIEQLNGLYGSKTNELSNEIYSFKENISKYIERIEVVERDKVTFAELVNEKQQQNFRLQHKLKTMQIQKQKYVESLNQKQLQNSRLFCELNNLQLYSEQLQLQNQKLVHTEKGKSEDIPINEKYNQLLMLFGKKHLQSIVLLSEINRLNITLEQNQEYLQKAQQYTVQLQENLQKHQIQLSDIKQKESPIEDYEIKLSISNNQIAESNQKIYHLQNLLQEWEHKYQLIIRERDQLNYRITTGQPDFKQINQLKSKLQICEMTIREYEQQISKFKFTRQQLQKQNQDLAKERDQFLLKISSLLSELQEKVQGPLQQGDDKRIFELQEQIKLLQFQLQQTAEHLKIAENFIEQKQKAWQEIIQIQTRNAEKQQQIIQLINDIQQLKTQNCELLQKIQNQSTLAEENSFLKGENQRLQNVIKKYEASQIQSQSEYQKILQTLGQVETQLQSANNQQPQEDNNLRMDVQRLTNQKTDSRGGEIDKFPELEQHLRKAESYIFQQEQKIKTMINTYTTQIIFLKESLSRAELYIKNIESRNSLHQHDSPQRTESQNVFQQLIIQMKKNNMDGIKSLQKLQKPQLNMISLEEKEDKNQ